MCDFDDNPDNSSRSELNVKIRKFVAKHYDQVSLAVATLLFFASVCSFIFMLVMVRPGALAQHFTAANCTVEKCAIVGNTSCYVNSVLNHGKKVYFPCVQISVSVDHEQQTSLAPTTDEPVTGWPQNSPLRSPTTHMLFQSEFNYYGDDHLYRRCSYLPGTCADDAERLRRQACAFAAPFVVGDVFVCYRNRDASRVILERRISVALVIGAFTWPAIGAAASLGCCFDFWRRNHKHVSRLYEYNSWAQS